MFVCLASFPEESLVIAKERASKMYGVSAYFLGKTLSEIPVHLLNPSIYFIIVYAMGGQPWTAVDFLGSWWVLIVSVIAAQSIGVLLSSVMWNIPTAMATVMVFMIATMLASGYLASAIPFWFAWIRWLSFLHYSFAANVEIYLLNGIRIFSCSSDTCTGPKTGEELLSTVGTFVPFWVNMLILHGIFVVTRGIAYLVLRFSSRLQLKG